MSKTRRSALVVTTVSLFCLAGSTGAAAAAAPQHREPKGAVPSGRRSEVRATSPDGTLKAPGGERDSRAKGPFSIGPATSPGGSIAREPNGSLVIAYDTTGTKIAVCTMSLGARRCSHITYLKPLSGDAASDTPQVFVTAANHVKVLQQTCCDVAPAGDDLLYTSTDGGRTFSAPVRVGSLNVDEGELVGSQIVFTANNIGTSEVESIGVTASGPPTGIATALAKTAFSSGVGQYKGGVLVGSDFIGSKNTTTYVEYAAKGTDFDSSASYQPVATFTGEHLLAMSGDVLLTIRTKHGQAALIRIFNGHGFGAAHVVPGTSGGGPEWFTVFQDPSGRVHVFSSRGLVKGYDLIEVSTSHGSIWSRPVNLGNAIKSRYFDAGLNRSGKGLVLGTDPARGYPVG